MRESSDELLIHRYRGGDLRAFEVLLGRYRRPLFSYLLRSTRDRADAEELYQDVWLRVVERIDAFRGESSFATWLYAIARHRMIDHQRRMKLRRHDSLDTAAGGGNQEPSEGGPWVARLVAGGPTAETEAMRRETLSRVDQQVRALPEPQRDVLLLRTLQGLTFDEIAEIVEASPNTVKSRMRYALERLRAPKEEPRQVSGIEESETHEL